MLLPAPPVAEPEPLPACAVVGMGRCVGPVRRAAADAGLVTVWFPEMEGLLRRPPSALSLVVLAPSMGMPEPGPALGAPISGPVSEVPHVAVIADGGLAHVEAPTQEGAVETFRFPLERDAFVAAAVEAAGDPSLRP